MKDKEKKKILRRKAGWVFMRSAFFLIKFLPFKVILLLGRLSGKLGYRLSARHRKITLDSLKIAFDGQKQAEERERLAKNSFIFMGQTSWELLYLLRKPEAVNQRVDIVGLDNLKAALDKGKGVIGLTAHLGNFPLLCLRLRREGFPVNVMARPMRDEKAGDFVQRLRTQAGIKTVLSYPRKRAVFDSLKVLNDNEILVIQMDQNFGTGGVWVKFFNRLAATPVGPVIMALRANAAVVPMFIVNKKEGFHTIFIQPEISLVKREDKDETVLLNTIKITNLIEGWVRKYPHLWSWVHRRWKSRPNKKTCELKFKVQKD